jgi:hypothetical protein
VAPATVAWTAPEPVSTLMLGGDWDYFASMAASLRRYLFEHHAVPAWNFMFCGGRPELGNPQGWAYAWPSLFAYALPPNWAIVALWIVTTAVGVCAFFGVARDLLGSRLGAATAACVYAFNGFFGAHFNVGHVSFAAVHLVPLCMLFFGRAVRAPPARRAAPLAGLSASAYLFFSGGLPAALLFAFPMAVLYMAWTSLVAVRRRGADAAVPLALAAAAFALGVGLAGYKLGPLVAWQSLHPRHTDDVDYMPLASVWLNATTFLPGPFTGATLWPGQHWCDWENCVYIGPVAPVAAALGVLVCGVTRSLRPVGAFAVTLGVLGVSLAVGAGHPLGLARWFQGVPVLSSIRVFARYQILLVASIALLDGALVAWAASRIREVHVRGAIVGALVVGICVPGIASASSLAWHVPYRAADEVRAHVGALGAPDGPKLAPGDPEGNGFPPERALLEAGFWVGACYEPMSFPKLSLAPADVARPPSTVVPLSDPLPDRLILGASTLRLAYGSDATGPVRLHLVTAPGFRVSAPVAELSERGLVLADGAAAGKVVVFEAPLPGARAGASVSGVSLCVGLVGLVVAWRRRQRAAGRASERSANA